MLELYEDNKERILLLCTLLLDRDGNPEGATTRIFRQAWELLLAGSIRDEAEFTRAVTDKAVAYCKAGILKRDPKAFRVPANKNFAATNYLPEQLTDEEDMALFIAHNLSPLHRFIYVLTAVFDYDMAAIAAITKMNASAVSLALEAEEVNIGRLLAVRSKQTGKSYAVTPADFHRDMKALGETLTVSGGVSTIVKIGIEAVCKPILEREKKKRKQMLIYGLVGALCICILGLGGWGIAIAVGEGNETTADTSSYDYADEDISAYTSESVTFEETADETTDETTATTSMETESDMDTDTKAESISSPENETQPEGATEAEE